MVSELSRLGRSVGEIITLHRYVGDHQIRVFALKEVSRLTGTQDLQTTVIVTLFGLFAEIERTLLSLRTKEALAAAGSGQTVGRPRGAWGNPSWTGRRRRFKPYWLAGVKGVDRQNHGRGSRDALSLSPLTTSDLEAKKLSLRTDRRFLFL